MADPVSDALRAAGAAYAKYGKPIANAVVNYDEYARPTGAPKQQAKAQSGGSIAKTQPTTATQPTAGAAPAPVKSVRKVRTY